MKRIPLAPADLLAVVGVALLAGGIALRFGTDLAAIVVGALLTLYAIALASQEQPA
jgi:hypothetical protein